MKSKIPTLIVQHSSPRISFSTNLTIFQYNSEWIMRAVLESNNFDSINVTVGKVPPSIHRRNKAERAVRTWKNHFTATLAGVNPDFPLAAWDKLIEQSEITLNHILAFGPNKTISS